MGGRDQCQVPTEMPPVTLVLPALTSPQAPFTDGTLRLRKVKRSVPPPMPRALVKGVPGLRTSKLNPVHAGSTEKDRDVQREICKAHRDVSGEV